MKTDAVRILIVDDHPLVRDGVRARLSSRSDWIVCGEAESTAEAMHLVRETRPHIVIIDLSLKNGNGLELIKQIAGLIDAPRVLVCTMHDEQLYAQRTIQAGASGYLHKQRAAELLIVAIEHVLEKKLFVSDEAHQRMLTRTLAASRDGDESPIEQLTDRELQVFEGIGRGMTVNELAVSLFLSPKTIETYRDRTKRKLNLRSSAELMRYAIRWVSEHNEN